MQIKHDPIVYLYISYHGVAFPTMCSITNAMSLATCHIPIYNLYVIVNCYPIQCLRCIKQITYYIYTNVIGSYRCAPASACKRFVCICYDSCLFAFLYFYLLEPGSLLFMWIFIRQAEMAITCQSVMYIHNVYCVSTSNTSIISSRNICIVYLYFQICTCLLVWYVMGWTLRLPRLVSSVNTVVMVMKKKKKAQCQF